jgi:hypothetical protein
MTVRWKKALVLCLGLGVVAVLLLAPLPHFWHGVWQSKFFDLGHVPLFAALTLLLWAVLGPGLVRPVLIALAVAGLAEIVQTWVDRTGDFLDFLRGALGAFAAAAGVRAWQLRRRRLLATGYLALIVGLVSWPVYDSGPYLLDAWEGARAFPVLADFHTPFALRRWRWRQADLTRTADPLHPGAWAGRLEFFPGERPYPYGALRPILRDFHAYRWLCCSLVVEEKPLELVISIRSGPGDAGETTHYQEPHVCPVGEHPIWINLPAVAPKANPMPLDLSDVWIIQFFLDHPPEPRTIYVQRVWLEE